MNEEIRPTTLHLSPMSARLCLKFRFRWLAYCQPNPPERIQAKDGTADDFFLSLYRR